MPFVVGDLPITFSHTGKRKENRVTNRFGRSYCERIAERGERRGRGGEGGGEGGGSRQLEIAILFSLVFRSNRSVDSIRVPCYTKIVRVCSFRV